jgi:prevent-host-death family protein
MHRDRDKYDHGHNHGHGRRCAMTKIMKASEFKAKCLAIMDEVAETGRAVVVTKNGKPLVELVPHKPKSKRGPLGIWKGKVKIKGDIISPIDVEWDAMK